jgi:virginiamycin A acetyltransferase
LILLRRNSAPPSDEGYGWLKRDAPLPLRDAEKVIEANAGLLEGPYKALMGGLGASGLCSIGAFSYSDSALPDGLRVGRYCSISTGLRFLDSAHPVHTITTSAALFRPGNRLFDACRTEAIDAFAKGFAAGGTKPYPTIGHDVWIGHRVTLAMGIRIGDGAIVAANSTVVRDVPPYAIVGGNPAALIRMRFDDALVSELLATHWWLYEPKRVLSRDITDPAALCRRLRTDPPPLYQPDTVRLAAFCA